MDFNKTINPLMNSDEHIFDSYAKSNNYIFNHPDNLKEKLEKYLWIIQSLLSVLPITIENITSGHIFPIVELQHEFESSLQFCRFGFYKHSMIALRNVLELGLLSVYWDIEDQGHLEIQNWKHAIVDTPFKRKILKKLVENSNIKHYNCKFKFIENINTQFNDLSDYAHTKGVKHSSHKFGNPNFNVFDKRLFAIWYDNMLKVLKLVVTVHVLKYPVIFQDISIEQKFGINGPMGGFLEPYQSERIKELFDKNELLLLQEISNNDPIVIDILRWYNQQPDITREDLELQFEKQDQDRIAMEGFRHWLSQELQIQLELRKSNPKTFDKRLQYWKRMKKWSKDNGYYTDKKVSSHD